MTVTGVDDFVQDGDIDYNILVTASSTDLIYNAINPSDVDVTNFDDDIAGMTIYPTLGLTTTEIGGTDSFTVVLNTQPTTFVYIYLDTLDSTEGIATPNPLEFDTTLWNEPQIVTVTGLNDNVVDGDIPYSIRVTSSSIDGNYNSLTPVDVSATNTDDDVAGITVSPLTGLSTTEGGGSDTFTVVLNSQPTANVTTTLSSSNPNEGVISTNSLVFTSDNWDTPQTVIVTGVNDSDIDGDIPYTITTSAAVSNDPHYDLMDPDDILVINSDDDVADIIVSPTSGLATTELGGTSTFTVVLESRPIFSVTINITSSNTTEGVVTPTSLIFTDANFDDPQLVTVTGVDDDVVDGEIEYTILTSEAISDDVNFSGLNPPDVTVMNADDDVAGITITPTSALTTTEIGGSDTFNIVLDTEPVASVIVVLGSSDTTEGTVPPSSLRFEIEEWNIPQTVTVTGINDYLDDGDQPYYINMQVSSGDSNYDSMVLTDVSVINVDDDVSGFSVDPISALTTTEAGGSDSFTIVLTSQPIDPTNSVSVDLSSSDQTEGTVSPGTLVFNAATWNIPQDITVTGVDDAVQDGNIVYTIISDPATSDDQNYDQLDAEDVSVTNTDDDVAGITISPTSDLSTVEDGSTVTFTMVIDSEPTHDVTIGLSSSRSDEGVISPGSVTFTNANWDTPQVITVTGVDDDLDDDDQVYTIITAAATSEDDNYAGLDALDVSVTNIDDDDAGVTLDPVSDLITTESGGLANYTMVLDSEPVADVIIVLSDWDSTEGEVSPNSLTFTANDWYDPQTVMVTGVDDDSDDGDQSHDIRMQISSADSKYASIVLGDVCVINLDDDGAGIVIDPFAGLITTEAGGTDTFDVVLASQPTAVVQISLSLSIIDQSEGTVSPVSLFFNAANWNLPQTVTVTGVDDLVDDGDVDYSIITHVAPSDDNDYSGIDVVDVSVTNIDDDATGIIVDPISGLNTTEAGGTDTFSVVLNSPPTALLTINFNSSDKSEGLVSPSSLIFTSANWNAPKTVTISGQDDTLNDGDIAYTITMVAESDDSNYNNYNIPSVAVTNLDNDHTPVAEPDAYITNLDQFFVAAPGVLDNDLDMDGQDTLMAVLQTDVRNGSLTLNEDGSFEYTPGLTFNGDDDFTYWASDGTNSSPSVKVSIVVDRVDPSVDWISPVSNGKQLDITNDDEDKIIQLEANPNDSKTGIERVYFYRWDARANANVAIGTVYTDPFRIDFDTKVLNYGFNQINVEAYDIAGNKSDYSFIWLYRYSYLYMPSVSR